LSGVVVGNCGNEPDAQRLIEDVRWVGPEDERRLLALFLDTKASPDALPRTANMALRNRVPVVVDPDGDSDGAGRIARELLSANVRVLHARQCYPGVHEDMGEFEARMRPLPEVVIRPGYVFGDKTRERTVAAANLGLTRMIAESPQVVADLVFGLDRNPRSQWCADYFRALCAATPLPAVSLREPAPIITPPVIPPPVVKPKPAKDKSPYLAAGGVGLLVAWLWKKLRRTH
jgi:hypothetical protein